MKDRLTIQEAAARLGVKEDAVRKRIQRGSLRHEKSPEGRVYVWVDAAQDAAQDAYRDALLAAYRDALLAAKDETIAELREQLREERRANDENRRLLLAALERIPPQLEAAQEPPQDAPSDA
jgi:excisionase family DNA binding protein